MSVVANDSCKTAPESALAAIRGCEEQLSELVACTGGNGELLSGEIMRVFDGVLPSTIDARAREKICKALVLVLSGETWGEASDQSGASWALIHSVGRGNQPYRDLLEAVRRAGDGAIRAKRLQTAHNRAVKGWDEPVWHQGVQVGVQRRFSDRLLELLLKGDDPGRYNPQVGNQGQQQGSGGPLAIQINVHLPGSTPATVDVTPQPVVVE